MLSTRLWRGFRGGSRCMILYCAIQRIYCTVVVSSTVCQPFGACQSHETLINFGFREQSVILLIICIIYSAYSTVATQFSKNPPGWSMIYYDLATRSLPLLLKAKKCMQSYAAFQGFIRSAKVAVAMLLTTGCCNEEKSKHEVIA